MQELLKQMQESRDSAYRSYKELELVDDERCVAYASGILEGINMMIKLVKEFTGNE